MPAPRSRFHDVDWQEVSNRLTAYAVQLFASARLLGPEPVMRGVGKSPADLAADTIVKVLTEEGVKYRSSKGPLLPFLAKVMLNDFKDLLRNAAYKKTVILSAETETPEPEGFLDTATARSSGAGTDDPLSLAIEKEQKGQIRHLLGNETDLRDVVDAVIELNCMKPSEIAEILEVSTAEVQNRKKKLRRRLAELHAQRGSAPGRKE